MSTHRSATNFWANCRRRVYPRNRPPRWPDSEPDHPRWNGNEDRRVSDSRSMNNLPLGYDLWPLGVEAWDRRR